MKSQDLIDRLTKLIILINTVLMLVGALGLRYDHMRRDTRYWSPAPRPFDDPLKTYRQPLI